MPVVSIGGQETAVFLTRGELLARLLGLDRMFRLKVLPISLALPWVLNVGDTVGHIPLSVKITIETLPPIHLRGSSGPSQTSTRFTPPDWGPRSDAAAGRLSGAGGLIEVVEWAQQCEFARSSVTGVDQRGRFRLRQIAAGGADGVSARGYPLTITPSITSWITPSRARFALQPWPLRRCR